MYGRICLFNTGLKKPKEDAAIEVKEKKRKLMNDIFDVSKSIPTPKKKPKIGIIFTFSSLVLTAKKEIKTDILLLLNFLCRCTMKTFYFYKKF